MAVDDPNSGVAPMPEAGGPPPSGEAAQKVNPPAIALMVMAGIGMALQLLGLIMNVLGVGMGASTGGDEGVAQMMSGGVGIVAGILGLIFGVVIIMGAMKMRRLESYNMALAASIIAMIPCVSPCCVLGLPFGIWSLVVLLNEDVKAAFQA